MTNRSIVLMSEILKTGYGLNITPRFDEYVVEVYKKPLRPTESVISFHTHIIDLDSELEDTLVDALNFVMNEIT
jgi:hypothetical protein